MTLQKRGLPDQAKMKKRKKKVENEEGERNLCVRDIIFLGEVFSHWAETKIFRWAEDLGRD
jgi:hypothetical protein